MGQKSKPGYLSVSVLGGPERILGQVENTTCKYASNDQPVVTLTNGLDGFSDGPEDVTITGKTAVPLLGREFDFAVATMTHADVDIVFTLAGVRARARGRVMDTTEATDAKNPNAIDFNFHGKLIGRA